MLTAAARRVTLVLDGEIIALSGPRPDFTALQRRMGAGRPGAGLLAAAPVMLIIFDALQSGREQLLRSPYVLRRAWLKICACRSPAPSRYRPRSPRRPGAAARHPRPGL